MRKAPNHHSNEVLNLLESRINQCIHMYVHIWQHKREKKNKQHFVSRWDSVPFGRDLNLFSTGRSLAAHCFFAHSMGITPRTRQWQVSCFCIPCHWMYPRENNACSKLQGNDGLNSSSYPKQSLHSKIIEWFLRKENRWWIWYLWQRAPARHQNVNGARGYPLLGKNRRAVSTKWHFIESGLSKSLEI